MSASATDRMIRLGLVTCLGVLIVVAGCGGGSGDGTSNGDVEPVDTTPPQISQCTVSPGWSQTGPFTISANVADDVAVEQVYAIVTPLDGLTSSTGVYMAHQGGLVYSGEFLPINTTREQTFRVSIHAADAAANTSTCDSQLGCILAPIPDLPF